ncbi:nucleoside-diphosphate sugar epimerase [Leptospira ognonensis]|uniref:Nucleoside-diphosphate sugar epimerase n=1 Tax=Leptospira ognonensis TaxID=2484945 RepID=A0A4R9K282_9LEPT|nr:NAD(P)H-binding protein [Leptospira ognonensis]TGL60112.1 nucleoside-diphosphate sugar epimerase [Leptospira ognonensis]
MKKLNLLLLGGTGLIGTEVLKSILFYPEIQKTIVWARNAPSSDNKAPIEIQSVTWESFSRGEVKFPKGIDAVICCLGTTIKKAGSQEKFREVDYDYPLLAGKKAKEAGVKSFLIVTAMGADANSMIFYNRVKGEIERELTAIGFPYLGIFRPSLLLGDRKEVRMGEKVGEVLGALLPFSLFGLKKYKPIYADFVARSMIKTAIAKSDTTTIGSSAIVEILENDQMLDFGKNI